MEPEPDTIQELYEAAFNTIHNTTKRLIERGNFNPQFIFIGCGGEPVFYHLDFSSQVHKRASIQMAAARAVWIDAAFAFLVSDVALGNAEQYAKGIMPIKVPLDDRREAAQILGWELDRMRLTVQLSEYRRSGSDRKTVTFIESELSKKAVSGENGCYYRGDVVQWFEDAYKVALAVKAFLPKRPD